MFVLPYQAVKRTSYLLTTQKGAFQKLEKKSSLGWRPGWNMDDEYFEYLWRANNKIYINDKGVHSESPGITVAWSVQ